MVIISQFGSKPVIMTFKSWCSLCGESMLPEISLRMFFSYFELVVQLNSLKSMMSNQFFFHKVSQGHFSRKLLRNTVNRKLRRGTLVTVRQYRYMLPALVSLEVWKWVSNLPLVLFFEKWPNDTVYIKDFFEKLNHSCFFLTFRETLTPYQASIWYIWKQAEYFVRQGNAM